MDRQEYLDQISALNRPVKQSKLKAIMASKIFWIITIGLVAFLLMALFSSIITGSKSSGKDRVFSLILHIDDTSQVINEYQPKVKASNLRSYSATLYSVLLNTKNNLTSFAEQQYNYGKVKIKEGIEEEQELAKEGLENELFEAKINGVLDRTYVRKMLYEISLITTEEEQILRSTNSDELKEILNTSYTALNTLYEKFNGFSETTN